MEWKDGTSYARDEERIQTVWEITPGREFGRIVVTCSHIHYPGQWVMHCARLGISTRTIKASTVEEAQQAAVVVVKKLLTDMLAELAATEGKP